MLYCVLITVTIFSLITDDCTVSGQCVGNFLTERQTPSIGDCLYECQTFEGLDFNGDGEPDQFCSFFEYDSFTKSCDLLSSCERVMEGCADCISGSVRCDLGPSAHSKIIILHFLPLHLSCIRK